MKQMARIILLALLLTASLEVKFAQEPSHYSEDGWRGLTLEQSSIEDATRILGRPAEDKVGSLQVRNASEWMTDKRKEKVFRRLIYKNFEEVKRAELSFLNNRLVMISLILKQPMAAEELGGRYGTDFLIIKGQLPKGSRPADYEGRKQGFAPGTYPPVYLMVTVSARSFVAASVVDVSAKNVLKRVINRPTGDALPGNIFILETISRSLSKH